MSKTSPTLKDLVDIQLEILKYTKKDDKIYHLCLKFFTILAGVTQNKIKIELEKGEDE